MAVAKKVSKSVPPQVVGHQITTVVDDAITSLSLATMATDTEVVTQSALRAYNTVRVAKSKITKLVDTYQSFLIGHIQSGGFVEAATTSGDVQVGVEEKEVSSPSWKTVALELAAQLGYDEAQFCAQVSNRFTAKSPKLQVTVV